MDAHPTVPTVLGAPGGDLNTLPLPEFYKALAGTGLVRRLLELARDEDLGIVQPPWRGGARSGAEGSVGGDITTAACIEPSRVGQAQLVMRSAGVVAGLEAVGELLEVFAPGTRFRANVSDGQQVPCNTTLGTFTGPLDEILELERTMLNLLSRLCGVATNTAAYLVAMLGGGKVRAKLYDTRKTMPGLRVLEKYAVRCGGGHSHRMGLFDAVLIKDNHIAGVPVDKLAAFILGAAKRARAAGATPAFVEVEVDTLDQLREVLSLPVGTVDIVLLDNMGPGLLREAVAMRDRAAPRVELEASGGVNLDSIAQIAQTGVDRISVGALTHGAISADLGLDITG